MYPALSNPDDWILRFVRTYFEILCHQTLQASSRSDLSTTHAPSADGAGGDSCWSGWKQCGLARTTTECSRRGYDVRGLLHTGKFTAVQVVSKVLNRLVDEVGTPMWTTGCDTADPETELLVGGSRFFARPVGNRDVTYCLVV